MTNPFETVINNICDAVINWVQTACGDLQLYILTYFSTSKLTPDPGTLFSNGGFIFFGEGWIQTLMTMTASIGYTIGIGLFLAGIIMMMLGFIRKSTDTILSLLIRLVLVIAAIGFGPAFITEVLSAGWQVLQDAQKIVGDGVVYDGGEEIEFGDGMKNSELNSQVGTRNGSLAIWKSTYSSQTGNVYDFIPTSTLGQVFYTDSSSTSTIVHLVGVDKFYCDGDTYAFDIVKNTYIYYVIGSEGTATDAYYVTSMPSEPDYIESDGVPYYSNIGISHVLAQNESEATAVSSPTEVSSTGVGATYLTCVITVALTKSLVELIFALIMRYVTLIILIIFDPASCGLLATSWTDRAFWTYKKMYINEVILLVFSHIWLALYLQILVTSNRFELNELVLYVMMWGFLKTGIQLEQKFKDMGLSTTQTAGSLVNELLATGAGMMMAGRMGMGAVRAGARIGKAGAGVFGGLLSNLGALTDSEPAMKAGAKLSGKPSPTDDLSMAAASHNWGGAANKALRGSSLTETDLDKLNNAMTSGGKQGFGKLFNTFDNEQQAEFLGGLGKTIGGQLNGKSAKISDLSVDGNNNIVGKLTSDFGSADVSIDRSPKSENAIPFTADNGETMYANVDNGQMVDSMSADYEFGKNEADDAAFKAISGENIDTYDTCRINDGIAQYRGLDVDGNITGMDVYSNGDHVYGGYIYNGVDDTQTLRNMLNTSGVTNTNDLTCVGVSRNDKGVLEAKFYHNDDLTVTDKGHFKLKNNNAVPIVGAIQSELGNPAVHKMKGVAHMGDSVQGSFAFGFDKQSKKAYREKYGKDLTI